MTTLSRRRAALNAVLVCAAVSLPGACEPAAPPPAERGSRPNILIVVADDLGFGDVGCYGSADARTPRLDALAREGVRAEQFYVASPICSPSRASLLSGRSPERHGLTSVLKDDDDASLDTRLPLMPGLLAEAGYRTGLVGKWHLGSGVRERPTRRGFGSFFGMLHGSSGYYTHSWRGTPDLWRNSTPVQAEGRYATELFTEEAVAFVQGGTGDETPWFLLLSYSAPHVADDRVSLPAPERHLKAFDDAGLSDARRSYLASVAALDEGLGQVLDALAASGQAEHTLVIFLSDNGPRRGWGSAAPLRGYKDRLDEGGIRVPLLARWPGHLPQGGVCAEMLSAMDLLPTLMVEAGLGTTGLLLEGRDLLPALAGQAPSPHQLLTWSHEAEGGSVTGRAASFRALRSGPYKLSFTFGLGYELHDVVADPGQEHELSRERPEELARLVGLMDARR